MTIQVVVDTHAVLWYLYNDPRLSNTANRLIDEVEQAGKQIVIAAITLAEIVYLVEKGRIQALAFDRIVTALTEVQSPLVEIPFDRQSPSPCARLIAARFPTCQIGL